jgi:hypothetical protein
MFFLLSSAEISPSFYGSQYEMREAMQKALQVLQNLLFTEALIALKTRAIRSFSTFILRREPLTNS